MPKATAPTEAVNASVKLYSEGILLNLKNETWTYIKERHNYLRDKREKLRNDFGVDLSYGK